MRQFPGYFRSLLLVAFSTWYCSAAEEVIFEFRNGMRIGPGVAGEKDSLSTNSFQQSQTSGEVSAATIQFLDDGLRLTYFNGSPRKVLQVQKYDAPAFEQIELNNAQEVARSGEPPSILGVARISPFNKYGRRNYAFVTTRGIVDVVQGITLLTPKYAKVEILRTQTDKFVLDQRIALSSIPSDQLLAILSQALDLSKSSDWLRVYKFYLQAERYQDAAQVINEAVRRFPLEMADRTGMVGQTSQLLANQKFEEIELLRNSGQQKLATQLLLNFPDGALPLETQIKLQDEIKRVQQQVATIDELTDALDERIAELPKEDQDLVAAIAAEIREEIGFDSAVRLSDFQIVRRDNSVSDENLVSLAIGGWLLGSGSGIQNFAVAKSLIRVRELVVSYLNESNAVAREQILRELRSEEGAQPQFLAKMLATMKPPQALPQRNPEDPDGMYRGSVTLASGESVAYVVQVPPEYDPNRKYPCVVALPGPGDSATLPIDWWCGPSYEWNDGAFRVGQATRYGYIVISPQWLNPDQSEYQYTEGEQARVLTSFRDACRRFSIDTDRVFISGHFDGATAAWDLAQAHPDMWAGAVMISPTADKYLVHYDENLKAQNRAPDEYPPATYIVYGERDGRRIETKVGTVATEYLTSPAYDSLVVEYRGRGSERFLAELPRIIEWMELSSHRRLRTPREINTVSMRPGDRLFYWLEAPVLNEKASGNPFALNPADYGRFEATLLDSANNGIRITAIPSQNRDAWIWLTPDMVDFSRPIIVRLRNDQSRHEVSPDIGVMLEDVRMRADRMHVFWQRIAVP